MPPSAIEKDAWVTLVLRMLFGSELNQHIVFKGGTSLSKVYGLIERFSEDIDLAIGRDYLGYDGDLTKGELRKLRRRSHEFSLKEMPGILTKQFEEIPIGSLIDTVFPDTEFSEEAFKVKSTLPEKTFHKELVLAKLDFQLPENLFDLYQSDHQ